MKARGRWAPFVPALLAVAGCMLTFSGASADQATIFDCDTLADGQHPAPFVIVTSPGPSAALLPGGLSLQGAAFDCHAELGAGISQVSVFLGPREAGVLLGNP